MSYLINNQQKMNDIIFAQRNREYGAYIIRSTYGNTVLKSLIIMLLGLGSLVSFTFYMSNRNNNDLDKIVYITPKQDSIVTVKVNLDEKKPEPQVKLPDPPNQNNSASQAISITITETASANTSTVLNENSGVGTGTTTEGSPSTPTVSNGNGTITMKPDTTTHYIADSNPEFEGGLRALYAFLGSNLKYPENAKEVAKEGTVHVKFVVDTTGKVCNLSLMNKLGYGLDEEALRVISLIPNFKKPGILKGKPVRVYYNLPIKFKMR